MGHSFVLRDEMHELVPMILRCSVAFTGFSQLSFGVFICFCNLYAYWSVCRSVLKVYCKKCRYHSLPFFPSPPLLFPPVPFP